MLKPFRWPLLCLGLYAMLTPATAQLAGRGKLLRTPETPFVPMDPTRQNYIGWEKFSPFSLAPTEKIWWDSFSANNDLDLMLQRGVTHQSIQKVPLPYAKALAPEKRAVMVGANSMEGARWVDNWYCYYDCLADGFTPETDALLGKISGFLWGQRGYLGINDGKVPISLVYLDLENRANYQGNLYARNVINGGNFAIRGAKGGYSNDQYLKEYRANHPDDTRDNATLLSMPVRNTVDNGIYCPGGPQGGLSEAEFLRQYGNGWGEKMCQIVRQMKKYNLMDGAKVGSIEVSPGEADYYLNSPYLADMDHAYRWPWGYNCGDAKQVGDWLDYSDAGFYPRVNSWTNENGYWEYVYYGDPRFEPLVQKNIANDRGYLYAYLNSFENSLKIKGNAGFIALWYPFFDGAPGPASTHFNYPLRNDMAEAMAIFGTYYGTTFIVWSPHGYLDTPTPVAGSAVFRACEYFIAGQKRMSWHNDMRTGDFQRVIPEISMDGGQNWYRDNTYQSKAANRPIVRAIVKGNEILVIGYNNTTNDFDDMTVQVRYNGWQDSIVLRGRNSSPDRRVYVGRAVMQ
jgi:hypothetical protein